MEFKHHINEPHYCNRFKVEFTEALNIKPYTIKSINRPKYVNDKWDNITIIFHDIIKSSLISRLLELTQQRRKKLRTNVIIINDLTPTGEVIDEWILNIDKIISIDFGENNYDNNDLQIIKMIIKPSKCTYRIN